MSTRIPVNLVTGFLGVGKTSALMKLLASKPADEYWAVVVNEFGEVGIDGASLSAAGEGLQVAEVPGGCICCTTSPMLRVTLGKLARGIRPSRLLIEPSGLGHPAGIIDLLRDPGLSSVFDPAAVIALLDPRHLEDSRYTSHETWRDQLQLADVLVINKCDLADEAQIERCEKMAHAFFPPKLAVTRSINGEFAPELLALELHPERWPETGKPHPTGHLLRPRSSTTAAPLKSWPLRNEHRGQGSVSCGWIFPPEALFASAKVADLFEQLGMPEQLGLNGLSRAKGIFQTERDWYRFDWVDGMPGAAPSAYRRDCRFEVIVAGTQVPDWSLLEAALTATLISC